MDNDFKMLVVIIISIIGVFSLLIQYDIKNNAKNYNYIISLPESEQLSLFQSCAKNYSLNCGNALYDYQKQH
jgi:hypothetical protein